MVDETAVFKIAYGLFFLGTEYENEKNICVVNTVAQVTQEPIRISLTMLKTNHTASLLEKSKKFSACVMAQSVALEDVAHFGQQSGRDTDKLANKDCGEDFLGNPTFTKGCNAILSGKVIETIDLDTHFLFIADLVEASILSNEASITYSEYRDKKSNKTTSASSPIQHEGVWQCSVCHYVYDGEIPFEDLPDDYVCPICKKPKSVFVKV